MSAIANVVVLGALEIRKLGEQVEMKLLSQFIKCISRVSQDILMELLFLQKNYLHVSAICNFLFKFKWFWICYVII